jgi:hypothetical protein
MVAEVCAWAGSEKTDRAMTNTVTNRTIRILPVS